MAHDAEKQIPTDPLRIEFHLARATALDAYATLESAMMTLYAHLMGVKNDIAGVTFFRLNNARQRNAILGRLIKKRHKDKYNLFWNSVEKHLNMLDATRNQVVHWTVADHTSANEKGQTRWMSLVPPNFWDRDENTPEMRLADVHDFIVKAQFFTRALQALLWTMDGKKKIRQSWRDICLQPLAYPPPNTHPLFQSWQEP